jgi:hypothetical protein
MTNAMSLEQFIVFVMRARPHLFGSLTDAPAGADPSRDWRAPSRVNGNRMKSMGDRKKFALAVRGSLVEREFARPRGRAYRLRQRLRDGRSRRDWRCQHRLLPDLRAGSHLGNRIKARCRDGNSVLPPA